MEERKCSLFRWWGIIIALVIFFIGGAVFGVCYNAYLKVGLGWLAIVILMAGFYTGFLGLGLAVMASQRVPSVREDENEDIISDGEEENEGV